MSNTPTLSLRVKMMAGIVLAILVLLVNQAFIQYFLREKKQDAAIINLAGRQRMLSQKLVVHAYSARHSLQDRATLDRLLQEWKVAHHTLLNGNDELGLEAVDLAPAIEPLQELNECVGHAEEWVNEFLAGEPVTILAFSEHQTDFLRDMNVVVEMLEADATAKLYRVMRIEIVLWLLSLVVIGLEVRYLYVPIFSALQKSRDAALDEKAKFETLLNSSTNATVFLDLEGRIVNVNAKGIRFLEQFVQEPPIQPHMHLVDSMPKQWGRLLQIGITRCLTGHITREEWQVPVGNEARWMSFSFFPVLRDPSHQFGIGIHILDVHDRKMNAVLLSEQNEHLVQIANRQSHEIRGPLARLKGLMSLIETENDDAIRTQYIELMKDPAEQLDQVIKEIVQDTHRWASGE